MSSPAITRRRALPHPLHPTAPSSAPSPSVSPAEARVAGRYRYDLCSGEWWWSPEMYTVLDLHPAVAAPSTELLVARQHPGDAARVLESLETARYGLGFAIEVRTPRSDGTERLVVLLGEPQITSGQVTAVEGVCVDVTDHRPL